MSEAPMSIVITQHGGEIYIGKVSGPGGDCVDTVDPRVYTEEPEAYIHWDVYSRVTAQRDAAVEALRVADAWFREQDDNDTHAEVVRAAIVHTEARTLRTWSQGDSTSMEASMTRLTDEQVQALVEYYETRYDDDMVQCLTELLELRARIAELEAGPKTVDVEKFYTEEPHIVDPTKYDYTRGGNPVPDLENSGGSIYVWFSPSFSECWTENGQVSEGSHFPRFDLIPTPKVSIQ